MSWAKAVKATVIPGRHGHRREKRGVHKAERRAWRQELETVTAPLAVSFVWDSTAKAVRAVIA